MAMFTSAIVAALMSLMMAGYLNAEAVKDDAERDLGSANGLAVIQSALLQRHVDERLPNDEDRGAFENPTQAMMTAFVRDYITPPVADGLDIIVQHHNEDPGNNIPAVTIITGFEHGGGYVSGLVWRGRVVEIHLFGDYTDDRVAGIARHIPQASAVPRNGVAPPAFAAEVAGVGRPGHWRANEQRSVGLIVPHPILTASLRDAVDIVDPGSDDATFVSPVVFDEDVAPVEYTSCGGVNALTLNADGHPMACIDIYRNGRRVWKRLEPPTDGYCVDVSAGPHSETKALNMTLAFAKPSAASWNRVLQSTRDITMTGILTGSGMTCPPGFRPRSATEGQTLFCEVDPSA